MSIDEKTTREEMVVICQRLYDKDIVPANGGNVSVRLNSGEVLVSPTGQSLADAKPDWFVKVDLNGNKLAGERSYFHRPLCTSRQSIVHSFFRPGQDELNTSRQ